MRTWIKQAFVIFLLNFVCSVHAEDITELVAGATSDRFTEEEKARFTEATDRFKKYEIPKDIKINTINWPDSEHLVFSSRKYPGWQAKSDEMSRVITYNVKTGAIADTGYRGLAMCLNHLGDLLLAQSDKESRPEVRLIEYQWLAGKWGQTLKPIDRPRYSTIANHLCRFLPEGDPIFTVPPEKQPPGFAMVMPLLPEHGVLETTVIRKKNGQIQDLLHLIKPNGERLLIGNLGLNSHYFTYLPWIDGYLETEVTPGIPRLFSPSGTVSSPIVPTLFKAWHMAIDGRAASYASRAGMLWGVEQHSYYWRKQGIFLQTNERLLRIEAGRHTGPIQISPDGCLVQAQVTRDNSFKPAMGAAIRVVINVCKELEK